MYRLKSIRAQLTLLVAAAVIPMVALVAYEIERHFAAEASHAQVSALARAREITARLDDLISDVEILLNTVSKTVSAAPADEAANNAELRSLKADLPAFFNNLQISALDGRSLGHSEESQVSIAARGYFRQIVAQRKFVVSEPVRGYTSGVWLIGFGRPVLAEDGAVRAVVTTSIRMAHFSEILSAEGLPGGSVIILIGQDGVVLARNIDPGRWVGTSVRDSPVVQRMLAHKTGVYESESESEGESGRDTDSVTGDGVSRLSGYATAKRVPWAVYVGIPASAAYAPAHASLSQGVLLALLSLAASILLAAAVAARITKPLRTLERDAQILSAGDLGHRTHVAASNEVGRLAAAFNDMAGALEARAGEREQLLSRLQLQLERMPVACVVTDEHFIVTYVNPAAERTFGFARADLVGTHPRETIIEAADWPVFERVFARLAHGEFVSGIIGGNVTRDGRALVLDWVNTPLFEPDGRFIGVMSMAQDITEKRRAEQDLREREERYRYLFESNPHPMWIYERATLRFLAVNQTAIDNYGYSREEFEAMSIRDIRPPADLPRLEQVLDATHSGKNQRSVGQHRTRDGTVLDVEVISHPFDFGGRDARLVLAGDVTGRVRAQRALEDSERRYRELFDHTPLPVWVRDVASLRFLAVNKAAVAAYGHSREEFLAMTTHDIRPPADEERYRRALEAQRADTQSRSIAQHRKKDGTLMDVEVSSHAMLFNGSPARLAIVSDITGRKRSEEALALERNLLRALIDNLPDHIYTKDSKGRYLISNRAHLALVDGKAEEVAGKSARDFFTAEVAEAMERHDSIVMAGNPVHAKEVPLTGRDGEQRWHLVTKIPLRDGAGRCSGLVGISRDITEQKLAERALRESEHQLRLVTDNVPAMMAYHDAGLVCRYANRRYIRFYAGSAETVVGRHQREVLGADGYAKASPYLQRLLRGESLTYEHTHLAADGTARELEVTGIPDLHEDGTVCGFYVTIQDFTERKKIEQALRDSEERLRTVANNVPALIGYIDADWRYGYVNKTYEDWYGRPASDYPGRKVRDIIGDTMFETLRPQMEAALAGETVVTERSTRSAHAKRYARFTYAPHFGDGRRVLGFYVLGYDITERRKAEEATRLLNVELERRVLERTLQLESANQELEAFSYSVSHDLRAPLRSIDGFSQALLEDYGGALDAQAQDFLLRIRRSSQRMAQLIDDLLGLSRVTRKDMLRSAVDLSALATEIARELQRGQPERTVSFAIQPGMTACADPNLMRIMLDNLLGNAWKFSAGIESAKIEFGTTLREGRKVYFVRDNGAGFDMAYAEKLFGAFQRLHDAKTFGGTGIGLATVRRIIIRHGGEIWAEGRVDCGATFYFVLP